MKNLIHSLFTKEEMSAKEAVLPSDGNGLPPEGEECKHQWQLVAKSYAAPIRSNGVPITSEDPRVLFGVTTCIWHCAICGVSYRDELLGTDENRWEDIVDKVEKFGMQYIKVGTTVFAVAKWVPPETDGQ